MSPETEPVTARSSERGPMSPKQGRPFNTSRPLGKIMSEQGWEAAELSLVTGIYTRTLTEYLSGRKRIKDDHLVALCSALEVSPIDLLG